MSGESSFWKWLEGARAVMREDLHVSRVENVVMAGMADVEGFVRGRGQFWAELKQEARPSKSATLIRFDMKKREKQIEWMRKRFEIGARCYWLLRVTGTEAPGNMIYMLPGDCGHLLVPGIMESALAVECATRGGAVFTKKIRPADIFIRLAP
jgi:hypothetical protein